MKKFLVFPVVAFLMSCGNYSPKTNNTEHPAKDMSSEQKNEKNDNTRGKSENITSKFISDFDISKLFLDSYFGAFGKNYQRIDLMLKSIQKQLNTPAEYQIKGATIMKRKEVPFKGIICIKNVQKSNLNPYQLYDSANSTIEIYADYKFEEDPSVSGSGIFTGSLNLTLVMDKKNKLYNNLRDWWEDGYSNFQFQGKWTSSNGTEYFCIFGDGRLKNSGDLDTGDGEFVPNEKYYKYGWSDYARPQNR